MVVQTDKGLGPGTIEPREYIRYATRDHLGDKRTYQLLTPASASYPATKVQNMLEKWIRTYLDLLSKRERKFLRTHLRENEEPWGFLYLLFKVHKNPLKNTTSRVILWESFASFRTAHYRVAATFSENAKDSHSMTRLVVFLGDSCGP